MKKRILTALLILATGLAFGAIYTIGSGSDTQYNVPVSGVLGNGWSKSIITIDELQDSGLTQAESIIGMGLNISTSPNNYTMPNQKIYIRHTDLQEYPDTDNLLPDTDGFTLVFDDTIVFNGSGWQYLTFTTPFDYNGTASLEIIWENRRGQWQPGYPHFLSTNTATFMSVFKHADGEFPGAEAGSLSNLRPNLRIITPQTEPPSQAELLTPMDGTYVFDDDVTLSWADGGGFPTGYKLYIGVGQTPQFLVDLPSTTTSYTLSDLLEDTTYYWKVVSYNEFGDSENNATFSFKYKPARVVLVGDGTRVQPHPFGHLWGYQRFAALYKQEHIEAYGMIERIGWECLVTAGVSVPYKIYMGLSNDEYLTSQTWSNFSSELTLVAEGNHTFSNTGWHIFEPETPISYTGGNLIIAVETNYGGSGGDNTERFYYTARDPGSTQAWEDDITPPTSNGSISNFVPNILLELGALSDEPMLHVSPSSLDFGMLAYDTESSPQNIEITNIGGGILSISADNLYFSGDNAAMFFYDEDVLPIALETGQRAFLPVFVRSTESGQNFANLNVEHGDDYFQVVLSANILQEGAHNIYLGQGTASNTTNTAPTPYGTYWRNFREQYLIRASEILSLGGTAGFIDAVSFNVFSLNNCSPMPNYRIRMKHTNQNNLSSSFETGHYQEMYQSTSFMPTEGWNSHDFLNPFHWDGESNILIDIVTDLVTSYSQNASVYHTGLGFNASLRFQSDSNPAINAATGTMSSNRPNIKLSMRTVDMNDMAAYSIDGTTTPSVGRETFYTVRIRNFSPQTVNDYTVKIMRQDGTELSSIAGTPVESMAFVNVTVPWTPSETGEILIYGRVEMPGDENPNNNDTPPFQVSVMDESSIVFQIGMGDAVNGEHDAPAPYGTWYRSFREQYLIKADEILSLGGIPGIISSIAFNVQDIRQCGAMPNYRIRLKHTNQTSLTSTMEGGDYVQVYQADSYTPTTGWNTHMFTTPFIWNGIENILVDIVTDVLIGSIGRNAAVYHHSPNFTPTVRFQSDATPGATATSGTTNANRPNLRLSIFADGMGSLSGMVSEDGMPLSNVLISIEEATFTTQTDQFGYYLMPFAPVGTHSVSASKYGFETISHTVEIIEDEHSTQNFEMTGIPEISIDTYEWDFGEVNIGNSSTKAISFSNIGGGYLNITNIDISGDIVFSLHNLPTLPLELRNEESGSFDVIFEPIMLGDATAVVTISDDIGRSFSLDLSRKSGKQNLRQVHTVSFSGRGVNTITIGEGNQNLRVPLDFYWKASVFQTLITPQELNNAEGLINGITLYNNFSQAVNNTPVMLWMGYTSQNNLNNGWISSDDLELVFDGILNFPISENAIYIEFFEPFVLNNTENLVLLFRRPLDSSYYSSSNYFKAQTWGSSRSRHNQSDGTDYDTTNLIGGTLSGQFPQITFDITLGRIGNISGYVRNEAGIVMQGVSITIGNRYTVQTNTQGYFQFVNVIQGNYNLSFSHYTYQDQSIDITLGDDGDVQLDITMIEMQKAPVLGRIIASDSAEGIEGAVLSFVGYANFETTTSADGSFIITPGVYTDMDYDYTIIAAGYTPIEGRIEVGDTQYDMGTITMDELAFAPTQVIAEISADNSTVNISWNPPDPDAFEISESFEGTAFPPADWIQTITNNSAPNIYGVRPTWCRFGTADGINPSDGNYQAGLTWITEHQDEWLFSPTFTCPPDAYLKFDTHLNMGSDGGDHYYVKLSTDSGSNWQILWDGADQPEGLNSYDTPVIIDLTQYAGQTIKLAWHADDGIEAFGMWYNWFIDNIYIGNFTRTEQLSHIASNQGINITETNAILSLKAPTASNRALTDYKVWRLRSGQEEAENNWILITDETLTETGFEDTGWSALAQGQYLWAVRAVYTSDVMSVPVFSNILTKELTNGTISGFVRSSHGNQPIAGATVSAGGQFNGTTTANGFYNISLPAGTYTVTATHAQYTEVSHENVVVIRDENTTLNFIMEPTSNEDVVEITVTALNSNYPNPFNPETTISYDIKDPTQVRLDVFNLKGQLVKTLVNDNQSSGRYNVVFTATDERGNKLSSGLYFYRLRAGDYSKTHKMMLME